MKALKNSLKKLGKDQSGQGLIEYVLILVVVISIALIFRSQIQQIVKGKVGDLGSSINSFNVEGN